MPAGLPVHTGRNQDTVGVVKVPEQACLALKVLPLQEPAQVYPAVRAAVWLPALHPWRAARTDTALREGIKQRKGGGGGGGGEVHRHTLHAFIICTVPADPFLLARNGARVTASACKLLWTLGDMGRHTARCGCG